MTADCSGACLELGDGLFAARKGRKIRLLYRCFDAAGPDYSGLASESSLNSGLGGSYQNENS